MIPQELDLVALIREIVREELDAILAARLPERREWVSLADAAAALSLTLAATWMRVKRGTLAGGTRGRRVYVSAESVRRAGGDV